MCLIREDFTWVITIGPLEQVYKPCTLRSMGGCHISTEAYPALKNSFTAMSLNETPFPSSSSSRDITQCICNTR